MFLWRFLQNILPTGKNIEKRKKDAAVECPFCNLEETQEHIFVECAWARRVWDPTEFRLIFENRGNLSCTSWFCEVLEEIEEEHLAKFTMILWNLWNERNNHLFNKKKTKEWEIVGKALSYHEEFLSARQKEERRAVVPVH
ncbi:unnamed protein product [Linum trigynum]|uniref:Reverse transcriptase zinc-binding domain-containing protein n=1 Tax=Linum trigynum TaxID=586398 RepID=A0AAV2D674_9ROSI